jgi:polysaccharide pyruvyl transferase WcaK-like protein
MSVKPEILLVGQADHDNFGDSLIFAVYVAKLNALGLRPKIVDATPIFIQRLAELGLSSDPLPRERIGTTKGPSAAIFIGGGYLGQPELSWIRWQYKFIRSGAFLDTSNRLREASIPIYVEGPECGPYYGPIIKNHIRSVMKGARSIAFRNTASQADAKGLGLHDAEYIPDVVLGSMGFLFPDMSSTGESHSLSVHATRKLFSDHWVARRHRKLLSAVVADQKFDSVSVIFDQAITSIEANARVWLEGLGVSTTQLLRYEGVEPLCRHLATASHVVTTKLHVGVTALSLGKRVACISSGHKNRRFYNDAGLPNAVVDFYFTSTAHKFAAISSAFSTKESNNVAELKAKSLQYIHRLESICSEVGDQKLAEAN